MEARWIHVRAEEPGSKLGCTDVATHQCFSSRTIKEQDRTTMRRTGGQQVSLEGRLKVREELREQTGPANPQPPELESTVTAHNPQTHLHGHDWRVDPKSKEQGRWGGIRGQNCRYFISPGSKIRNKQNT